jgi:hypothetical protein
VTWQQGTFSWVWFGSDADQLMLQLVHRDLAARNILLGLVWFGSDADQLMLQLVHRDLAARNVLLGLVWFRC